MIYEILYTVDFIGSFMKNNKLQIPNSKILKFKQALTYILIQNYVNIWDIHNPNKHKNLRSIKFNYYIDYQVIKAWQNKNVNLPLNVANIIFPTDLIIYCDPHRVTLEYKHNTKILFQKL